VHIITIYLNLVGCVHGISNMYHALGGNHLSQGVYRMFQVCFMFKDQSPFTKCVQIPKHIVENSLTDKPLIHFLIISTKY
jgi:hypothetical protein